MNTKPDDTSREDTDTGIDWETLDSQVSAVLRETQAALEEALAATQRLSRWVECLHTMSSFMRQVESGLGEVRHQLKGAPEASQSAASPSTVPKADTPEVVEPWPLEAEDAEAGQEPALTALEAREAESAAQPSQATAVAEAGQEPALTALEAQEAESAAQPSEAAAVAEAGPEPALTAVEAQEAESATQPFEAAAVAVAEAEEPAAPAEGEPLERAPLTAEVRDSIRLQIESSEANIDLMVVERALRETPGVADVDLLDYAGKRARVQVTFSEGERPEEVADPERLAANVQERLAKVTWDGSLSVSATE
jgi:hypothetical protein